MAIKRVIIERRRGEYRFVVELSASDDLRLRERLTVLKARSIILGFEIQAYQIDPMDGVRLEQLLSEYETTDRP